MKILDRILQRWRINKGIEYIQTNSNVLDIGNYDEVLFQKLKTKLKYGIGIDPLAKETSSEKYKIIKGYFPKDLHEKIEFDAITLFAVLEHIPVDELDIFVNNISNHLKANGVVIMTVPSKTVDKILSILTKLKLVDGMSLEEHHGYDTNTTESLFNKHGFKLVTHQKFQLGVNNLFVFKKIK